MSFDQLVKYIKNQGCAITVYRKKRTVGGVSGYFLDDPKPHIKIAIKGRRLVHSLSLLLHEYGHFLQFKDPTWTYIDKICLPTEILDEWLDGKIELTEREIRIARNTMLAAEYDAEMKALDVALALGVEGFCPDFHLREAYSYVGCIKWAWANRMDWEHRPPNFMWPKKRLSTEELFAPLNEEENNILSHIKIKNK